jgi:hypothetical protein
MSPWSRETLNRMQRSLEIGTIAFLSMIAGIPSGPGAAPGGIAWIASQKSVQSKNKFVRVGGSALPGAWVSWCLSCCCWGASTPGSGNTHPYPLLPSGGPPVGLCSAAPAPLLPGSP